MPRLGGTELEDPAPGEGGGTGGVTGGGVRVVVEWVEGPAAWEWSRVAAAVIIVEVLGEQEDGLEEPEE